MSEPLIEVELSKVSRVAERTTALLQFGPGKLNTLMAPNGYGKTLLVGALAFRGALQNARIGRSGHRHPREIAFLPQRVGDVDDISLAGLINLSSRGEIRQLRGEYLRQFARMSSSDLDQLSGGQRRLLLFLVVAAQEQRIHIYDEPFQALDVEARKLVTSILGDLVRENRLVIVVAHSDEIFPGMEVPEVVFHLPWRLQRGMNQ